MTTAILALAVSQLGDAATTAYSLGRGLGEGWPVSADLVSQSLGRWLLTKLVLLATAVAMVYLVSRYPKARFMRLYTQGAFLTAACLSFLFVGHNLTLLGWL